MEGGGEGRRPAESACRVGFACERLTVKSIGPREKGAARETVRGGLRCCQKIGGQETTEKGEKRPKEGCQEKEEGGRRKRSIQKGESVPRSAKN